MSVRFPLALSSWADEEMAAFKSVVESGRFTMGGQVESFEKEFAREVGSSFAVMVNSGSSANLLMVSALFYTSDVSRRLQPGDEVIVPAVSWSTTYSPLQQLGLKLCFVDIDIETLNFDLDALRSAISDKTRLIFAVNLLGNPNEFSEIFKIIDGSDIQVIEDNCESMGASYQGKSAGTFGLMGSFSTFFSHHISTMEGGVVVTDCPELNEILRCQRAHGWTRDLPEDSLIAGKRNPADLDESFRFILPGFNVRPLEISGAIGVQQVRKLHRFVEQRRENAQLFLDCMCGRDDLLTQRELGRSSWFGFSLVVTPGVPKSRERLIDGLRKLGFEVRPIVSGNFTRKAVMSHFDFRVSGGLPNADLVDSRGVFIGNHPVPMPGAFEALSMLQF